jgi:hypothetical protein
VVEGLTVRAKLDYGGDFCIISPCVVEHRFDKPKVLIAFSGGTMENVRDVCLDLCLPTECGDLHGLRCWVATKPMPR